MKFKNAQIKGIAVFIITLVSVAITLLLGRHIFVQTETGLMNINASAQSNQLVQNVYDDMDSAFSAFDNAILFVVVGLTIILLFSSFLIPSHPIFLVINLVGLVVLVFIAGVTANLYGNIISDPDISQSLKVNQSCVGGSCEYHMTKTTFIMVKLPWISAIVVMLSTIVMFAKGRAL